MPLNPGDVIVSRYKIIKKLGQGGFGAVYQAEDLNLRGKLVALKENIVDKSDPHVLKKLQKQFESEAILLSNLDHPNLPSVTDFFTVSSTGLQYLIMDYIPGLNLTSYLNTTEEIVETDAIPIMTQLLDALIYIHSQTPPVIHRDIKPPNIIITKDNRVFLVDFGISKIFGVLSSIKALTPHYAPPEQYGSGTDARSDIYSLGATFYTLLTGKLPTESMERLLGKMLIPPRQLKPVLSISIENIILKAMELKPDQRYQSAKDLLAAISAAYPAIGLHPVTGVPVKSSIKGKPTPAPAMVQNPKNIAGKFITVSTDGSSKYRTIKEGIAAAGSGGIVYIRPGVYVENLTIYEDIEIIGDGDRCQIILEAAGNQEALYVKSGNFKVSNISIRATHNQSKCIYMLGGTSVLRDCDISGGDFASVVAKDCITEIHNCIIHGSNQSGLIFSGHSSGLVVDCEVFDNKGAYGVKCVDASSPSFKRCMMYQNKKTGVACFDDTSAAFEQCEMYENINLCGVQCSGTSSPTFKRCKMYQNKGSGVACYEDTTATFEQCEMFENKEYHGVECFGTSSPSFTNCMMYQNHISGITCIEKTKALFVDCEAFDNWNFHGVQCAHTSSPSFKRCKMYQNHLSGVACTENTKALFVDCEMLGNDEGYGVQCTHTSSPSFKRCKMYQNKHSGVACYEDTIATFEQCDMFENKEYHGVECSGTSLPSFTQCKMYQNHASGVACLQNTKAKFEDCIMTGNRDNFLKADTSHPTLVRCQY